MSSLSTKLAFSALAIAMLATPAFAQHQQSRRHLEDYAGSAMTQQAPMAEPLHYPNGGAGRTGTAESYQDGSEFNLGY